MRATVSDIKHPVYSTGSPGVLLGFTADLRSVMNYYSFACLAFGEGMEMPGRCGNSGNYRYGFNTQEKDDEIYGSGNSYTAEYWQYDSRLGRRWNLDPLPNTSISSYACFANNPVFYCDPFGDTIRVAGVMNEKNEISEGAEFFRQGVESIFNGKVSVAYTNPNEKDDYSVKLTLNEGAVLNDEEQAAFNYISGLNSAKKDFLICLFNRNSSTGFVGPFMGTPRFFTNKVSALGEDFDVVFNLDYLKRIDADKPFKAKDFFLLGIVGENVGLYNTMSDNKIKKFNQGKKGNFLISQYNLFGYNIYRSRALLESSSSRKVRWSIWIPSTGPFDLEKVIVKSR